MRFASTRRAVGFTLVELLVVVSIIALLISILLPSLKTARNQAKAVKCAANARQVGQATSMYLAENSSFFPPSYAYPTTKSGGWSLTVQSTSSVPNGYLHWSYFLYSGGKVKEEAFQCPNFNKGGAPRTNPGPIEDAWNSDQIDDGSNTSPNTLVDKQAVRMAYTANASIIPRNKFTPALSGGQRTNVLVQENRVKRPGDTILYTEYLSNWRALGVIQSGKILVKSHRPVNVFYHLVPVPMNTRLPKPTRDSSTERSACPRRQKITVCWHRASSRTRPTFSTTPRVSRRSMQWVEIIRAATTRISEEPPTSRFWTTTLSA